MDEKSEHIRYALEIVAIYAKLLARQEPLGPEFDAAIFDDIESLYERSAPTDPPE